MQYKLTVIKYDEDKDYEAKLAKWKADNEENRYRRNGFMSDTTESIPPDRQTATRSLEVFLSDEEYEKLKQEVIKIFK